MFESPSTCAIVDSTPLASGVAAVSTPAERGSGDVQMTQPEPPHLTELSKDASASASKGDSSESDGNVERHRPQGNGTKVNDDEKVRLACQGGGRVVDYRLADEEREDERL
ncbi:hypothetical protein KEM52_006271 [Ascosphaera acerosa]|nr:hypothetical protein KEM52_006271 [Ascosphaera acerosa]